MYFNRGGIMSFDLERINRNHIKVITIVAVISIMLGFCIGVIVGQQKSNNENKQLRILAYTVLEKSDNQEIRDSARNILYDLDDIKQEVEVGDAREVELR